MLKRFNIVIVGCGGTGSSLIPWIARYCNTSAQVDAKLMIVDGDAVEFKNLTRQIFTDEDAGRNKALVFADAINENFDCNMAGGYDRYIGTTKDLEVLFRGCESGTNVLIGCVDNAVCRDLMRQFFYEQKDMIYIDTGNDFLDGQCVVGIRTDGVTVSPSYDYYFGTKIGEGEKARADMSCSELNASTPQHFSVNILSAWTAFGALVNIMEDRVTEARGLIRFDARKMNVVHEAPEQYGFSLFKETKKCLDSKEDSEKVRLARNGKFLEFLCSDPSEAVRHAVCLYAKDLSSKGSYLYGSEVFLRMYGKISNALDVIKTQKNSEELSAEVTKAEAALKRRYDALMNGEETEQQGYGEEEEEEFYDEEEFEEDEDDEEEYED